MSKPYSLYLSVWSRSWLRLRHNVGSFIFCYAVQAGPDRHCTIIAFINVNPDGVHVTLSCW